MNIIEAIKSGKPFSRKEYSHIWYHAEGLYLMYSDTEEDISGTCTSNSAYALNVPDLLADNWEIEEETITITKARLIEALQHTGIFHEATVSAIALMLGFKDV